MGGGFVELYFPNKDNDDLVVCEISNWSGECLKVSKEYFLKNKIDITNKCGVYLLVLEKENHKTIYVGESEDIPLRINQHVNQFRKERIEWSVAFLFTERNLNKTFSKYLESRLCEIFSNLKNIKLLTKNTYQNTIIKKSHKDFMEEFLENIIFLLKIFGFDMTCEIKHNEKINKDNIFCCSVGTAIGIGKVMQNKFIVLKGSIVSNDIQPSFRNDTSGYFNLRQELECKKVIKDRVFTCDYKFNSPSAASSVVLGRASNGRIEWKSKEGLNINNCKI